MKNTLIIAILLILSNCMLSQNKTTSYIQMSAGYNPNYSYVNSSKDNSMYFLSCEYGKNFKWLDIGLSVDYENGLYPFSSSYDLAFTYQKETEIYTSHNSNTFNGIINTALMLNVKINLIKFIKEDSKHSLKIGASYGVGFLEEINSFDISKDIITWWYHSSYNWFGAYKFSYEFNLTPNISIGAFYNRCKVATFGLNIVRNF